MNFGVYQNRLEVIGLLITTHNHSLLIIAFESQRQHPVSVISCNALPEAASSQPYLCKAALLLLYRCRCPKC